MRVRENPLRDLLRLVAWYPFRWLTERLPPRMALAFFQALGDIHWAMAAKKRARLAQNIQRLGQRAGQDVRHAIRENFRTHYVSQLLIFIYPRLTWASLGDLAELTGLQHLDAALAKGRGAVLIQAHFGPEQLALAALSLRGHQVMQIGCLNEAGLSPIGRGVSLRLRGRYEAKIPGQMLDARQGILPALRLLRENGLVLCAGDGAGWEEKIGQHVPVQLLGQTVLFPTGAARMALGRCAALLPLFVVRGKAKPFAIVIEEPIGRTDGPLDEIRLAQEFARRYERRLLENPGFMRFLELFEQGGLIEPEA